MTTHPELAYSFQPKLISGQLRNFVISTCSSCQMPQQFRWNGPNNPNHVAARFQRLGWDFDPYRASRNLCSICNPHYKEKTAHNQIALPTGFKTAGERITWLRARLHQQRIDIATAACLPERTYKSLEDNQIAGFHELHTAVAKVVPVFRKHNFPITLRWVLGLPEEGSCLAINFKAAMDARSLTTGFLAAQSQIPIGTIEGICTGAITSFYRLDELARALGTTVETLLSDVAPLPKETKPPAVADTALPVVEPPALTEVPKDRLGLIGRRLRDKREGEGLSQADLASQVYDLDGIGDYIGMTTLHNYLSKIERGQTVAHEVSILRACASIFHTNPNWQCGIEDDPEPVPLFNIEITDRDSATAQITALRDDLTAIESLVSTTRTELQGYEELLGETRAKLSAVEQAITRALAQPVPTILMQPVAPPPPQIAPPQELPQNSQQETATVAVMNGVDVADDGLVGDTDTETAKPLGVSSWVSNSPIDRDTDTKQNKFASLLTVRRCANKALTLDTMFSMAKHFLAGSKPREALRRMAIREAIAPNGRLVLVAPGTWKVREDALEAAE